MHDLVLVAIGLTRNARTARLALAPLLLGRVGLPNLAILPHGAIPSERSTAASAAPARHTPATCR